MPFSSSVDSVVDEAPCRNVNHLVWESSSSDGSEAFVNMKVERRSGSLGSGGASPMHMFWSSSGIPVAIDSIIQPGPVPSRSRECERRCRKDGVSHWTSKAILAKLQSAGDALTSGGEADVDVGADCANEEVEDTSCGEESPKSSPPSPSSQVTAPARKFSARSRRRRPRSRAVGAGRTATLHTVWDLSGSSEDTCDCDAKEQRQRLDRYREICFRL